jgi:GT2 family glycosyltransferase
MNPSDVTLAVPCYNAADVLPETLDAILDMDSSPSRILCVDDGSTDATRAVVERYPEVEYVPRSENGGVAAARNTALEHTETPGLAMVDSDVTLSENWLDTVTSVMRETGAAVVSARTIERVSNTADLWRAHHASVTMGDAPKTNERIATANVLFRTRALRAVDGWDERYVRAHDDTDVCHRLLKEGYTIRYITDTECVHRKTDSYWSVLNTAYHYKALPWRTSLDIYTPTGALLRIGGHLISMLKCVFENVRTANPRLLGLSLLLFPYMVYMDLRDVYRIL